MATRIISIIGRDLPCSLFSGYKRFCIIWSKHTPNLDCVLIIIGHFLNIIISLIISRWLSYDAAVQNRTLDSFISCPFPLILTHMKFPLYRSIVSFILYRSSPSRLLQIYIFLVFTHNLWPRHYANGQYVRHTNHEIGGLIPSSIILNFLKVY